MFHAAERLAALVQDRLGSDVRVTASRLGEVAVEVTPPALRAACVELRDGDGLRFGQLVDLCGVDYLEFGRADWETSESATGQGFSRGVQMREHAGTAREGPRFAVVYHLLSHELNQRIRLRCAAHGDPPVVESVLDIWSSGGLVRARSVRSLRHPVRRAPGSAKDPHRLRLRRTSVPKGLSALRRGRDALRPGAAPGGVRARVDRAEDPGSEGDPGRRISP